MDAMNDVSNDDGLDVAANSGVSNSKGKDVKQKMKPKSKTGASNNVTKDVEPKTKPDVEADAPKADSPDVKPDVDSKTKADVKPDVPKADSPDVKPDVPDTGSDSENPDNSFDLPLMEDGTFDPEAMMRQTEEAVKKFEQDLEKLRGKDWKLPPEPTTQERLAMVGDVAKDHARTLRLAKYHGWTHMESLNETPGMKSLKKLLMGPPAERKAAFDTLLSVQAVEYYGLSQACQAELVLHFDGDPDDMGKTLAAKNRADTHLLKLVELHARLSTPTIAKEPSE